MDKLELADLLLKRLYIELQLFKDDMLCRSKEAVYNSSYKIEIYVNLYEILKGYAEDLREDTIRRLLKLNFGILEFLYEEWLSHEDSFFDELKDYACDELQTVSEFGNARHGKEGANGTELDKAA